MAIEVGGPLANGTSMVSAGTISSAFAIGRELESHQRVLVPFLSCELKGEFAGHEGVDRAEIQLTYDNVAFLFMQFGAEFEDAIEEIAALATSRTAPARLRLDYAIKWLSEGSAALARSSRRLAELSASLSDEAVRDAAPSAESQLTRTAPKRGIVIRKKRRAIVHPPK